MDIVQRMQRQRGLRTNVKRCTSKQDTRRLIEDLPRSGKRLRHKTEEAQANKCEDTNRRIRIVIELENGLKTKHTGYVCTRCHTE
jgi:hypothetical protein